VFDVILYALVGFQAVLAFISFIILVKAIYEQLEE